MIVATFYMADTFEDQQGLGHPRGRAWRGRAESAPAQQQVQAQSQATRQATRAQLDNFRNAFSACLEGKQYIAKF